MKKNGKDSGVKPPKNIKATKAWKEAVEYYSALYAENMLPPQFRIGPPRSAGSIIEELQEIIDGCPYFYPAHIDLGTRLLSENIDKATEILDTGFEIGVKTDSWDTISKVHDAFVENAENVFHEEFVVKYTLKLIETFPDKAVLYDTLAYALATLGEQDKAIEYGKKAVALAPNNSYFLNNLGMYYLSKKCYDDAAKYFIAAIKAKPDHENPKTNLADCKKMKEQNLSSKEYYLRPADYEKIEIGRAHV